MSFNIRFSSLCRLLLYPIAGIIFVNILSYFQKLYLGVEHTHIAGYAVSSLTGLLAGSAIATSAYWYEKSFLREKENRHKIHALNQNYEQFLHTLSEGICTIDSRGLCLYANNAALKIFDCDAHDIIGKHLFATIQSNVPDVDKALSHETTTTVKNYVLQRFDGSEISTSLSIYPSLSGHVLTFTENSSTESALKSQIDFLHNHDPLSGFLNKDAWRKKIEKIYTQCADSTNHNILFIVDLDSFKVINETISYAAGDHFLKDFSQYLVFMVGSTKNISRIEGDKFSFLLKDCSISEAKQFGNNLLHELNAFETNWQGKVLQCSVSIGCCPVNQTIKSFAHVLQGAEAACKLAKNEGRSRIRFFDPELDEYRELDNQMKAVSLIKTALARDLFFLRGQKIASLGSQENNDGMEILISMKNENNEIVSPGEFIPAAERFDLMHQIDHWVIRETLKWMEMNESICEQLDFVSINLSGKTFNHEGFLDFLCTSIENTSVTPHKLCFEITETAAIQSRHAAIDFIQNIKKLGCRFALDDFGTGMSSFEYLRHYPIDFIKIDGSFVKNLEQDEISQEIVHSIQRIGEKMQIKTIAEHAESKQTLSFLQNKEIDYVQGYIVHKPEPLL